MAKNNLYFSDDQVQRFVRKTIINYIENHKKIPSEAKYSLRDSHHVNLMVQKMSQQIKDVQACQIARGRNKIGEPTLKGFVNDFTELFIKGFLGHIERRQQSTIEKYKSDHADDDVKDMQSTLEGKSKGAFEDMGLVIPDEQQEKTENHIKEPLEHGILVDYGRGRDKKASQNGSTD